MNAALRGIFDVLLYPLLGLSAFLGVAIVSLITAVGMLLIFRYGSDQDKMAAVKSRIHGCIFEIRLFNDDLRAIVRAQLEILRHNASYIKLTLKPMLYMIVPIVLLIAQLQFHYGYSGLEPGQSAVLKVALNDANEGSVSKPVMRVDSPSGLRVETSGVWVPSLREMAWRIGAVEAGEHEIQISVDGKEYAKSVLVAHDLERRSPIRLEPGFFNQLLYPAEDPLPGDSPIRSIEVVYPEAEVDVLGWFKLHWLIVFFVLSIVFAFSLKSFFGVTI
jgi:uncharacterized membrane protein (DUF106 family)